MRNAAGKAGRVAPRAPSSSAVGAAFSGQCFLEDVAPEGACRIWKLRTPNSELGTPGAGRPSWRFWRGPRPSGRFNGYWNQTVRISESSSPRREDWLGQADTRLFNPDEGYLTL